VVTGIGAIFHLVVVYGVFLVFLATHPPEIVGVNALLARIAVVEMAAAAFWDYNPISRISASALLWGTTPGRMR
jgi:hypothetical protein